MLVCKGLELLQHFTNGAYQPNQAGPELLNAPRAAWAFSSSFPRRLLFGCSLILTFGACTEVVFHALTEAALNFSVESVLQQLNRHGGKGDMQTSKIGMDIAHRIAREMRIGLQIGFPTAVAVLGWIRAPSLPALQLAPASLGPNKPNAVETRCRCMQLPRHQNINRCIPSHISPFRHKIFINAT